MLEWKSTCFHVGAGGWWDILKSGKCEPLEKLKHELFNIWNYFHRWRIVRKKKNTLLREKQSENPYHFTRIPYPAVICYMSFREDVSEPDNNFLAWNTSHVTDPYLVNSVNEENTFGLEVIEDRTMKERLWSFIGWLFDLVSLYNLLYHPYIAHGDKKVSPSGTFHPRKLRPFCCLPKGAQSGLLLIWEPQWRISSQIRWTQHFICSCYQAVTSYLCKNTNKDVLKHTST